MNKPSLYLAAMLSIFCVGLTETSWGRGFGGMHGGFGGMHGGGFGGMHGGGGNFGGTHRGGFGGGGNFGGMHAGGLGGGGLGGLGGGGLGGGGLGGHGGGGLGGGIGGHGGGGLGGLGGGGLGGGGNRFPGGGDGGFGGRRPGEGGLAGLGAGKGGLGAGKGGLGDGKGGLGAGEGGLGKSPDRNQLGSFLGLPSDGGMNKLSANHIHVGNTQIGGTQVNRNQIGGTQVDRNRVGQTQIGRNQIGADARGMTRYSNRDLQRRGAYVRRDFDGRGYYSADWYRRYPGAWYPRRYAYGNVWTAATWDSMGGWFGYRNTAPVYYDYGNNVTYQDNSVYMNGQDLGTADQYYEQAQTLAESGSKAPSTDDTQWMPLGVFAMTHGQQANANLIVQLAVDKQGVIRGNYTAKLANDTKPIHGSVDKKTQRAAFTIGDDKQNVIETGIYNLTKAEAPILVHFGEGKTEQWTLVRLSDDGKGDGKGSGTETSGTQQQE